MRRISLVLYLLIGILAVSGCKHARRGASSVNDEQDSDIQGPDGVQRPNVLNDTVDVQDADDIPSLVGFTSDDQSNVVIHLKVKASMTWPAYPLTIVDDDGIATLAIIQYTFVSKYADADNHATIQRESVENWNSAGKIYLHAFKRAVDWYRSKGPEKMRADADLLEKAWKGVHAAVVDNRVPTIAEVSLVGAYLEKAIQKHSYRMKITNYDRTVETLQYLGKRVIQNPSGVLLGSCSLDQSRHGSVSMAGVQTLKADWAKLTQEYFSVFP